MDHPHQPPPCHDQSGASLGQGLASGDSETSQLGPSEHFEHACCMSSGNRPTPLGGWGGHREVIFFCLRLSRRRPRGQLSSSPDFEAGKKAERQRGQAQSPNQLRKSDVWPGQSPPQLCPQASRNPCAGVLNWKGCFDPE